MIRGVLLTDLDGDGPYTQWAESWLRQQCSVCDDPATCVIRLERYCDACAKRMFPALRSLYGFRG